MAITGRFAADFASFYDAVQKAETSLKGFEQGSHKVETALNRMVNSFSGTKIIQDAALMTEAVERVGGVSKLTEKELARVGATAAEAAAKMRAMGLDVPPKLQAIADAAGKATTQISAIDAAARKTEVDLARMVQSFSGSDLIQDAALMVRAVDQIGGVSKLTGTELARLGATATEAIAKMRVMGVDVPPGLQAIANAAGKADTALDQMVVSFSGAKVIQDAELMVKAVDRVGGVSKLTATELARVGATATEAAAKMRAMGVDVPPGIQKIADHAKSATGAFGNMRGVVTSLAGAFGVAFSVGAVVQFGKAIFQSADELTKLHDKTGLSVTALQQFQVAGNDAGNTIEQLATAVTMLENRIAGGDKSAAAAIEKLGISLTSLKALSPEQQFIAISDAIRGIADPAQQVNIAMDLFGRTGAEVLPTLKRGFDDVRDGATGMSEASVAALDRAGDRMTAQLQKTKNAIGDFLGSLIQLGEAGAQFDATFGGVFRDTAPQVDAAAAAMGAFGAATTAAADAVAPWTERMRDARVEVADLTKAEMAEIEAMQKLGALNEQVATTFHLTEDAVRLLGERFTETTKAQAMWSAELVKSQENAAGLENELDNLMAASAATAAELRDHLFGRDVIDKARAYAEAIGSVSDVTKLTKDAAVELSGVLAAGIAALEKAGHGSEELARKMRLIKDAADAIKDPVVATFKAIEIAAARAAASAQAAADAVARAHAQGRAGVVPDSSTTRSDQAGGAFPLYTYIGGVRYRWDVNLKRYVPDPEYRASGGPVTAGDPYVVGERGPELFVPKTSGTILPSVSGGRGGVGGGTVVNNTFHVNGTAADVARQVSDTIMRQLKQSRQYSAA